ncbi:MAG: hypothetical protein WAV41_05515 [Microgenomates group bacterium]
MNLDSYRLRAISQIEARPYPPDFANSILAESRVLLLPLVNIVESESPGHMAGHNKIKEMDVLTSGINTIGDRLNIHGHDLQILKIILGTHDTGRISEYIQRRDTLASGQRHGILSAQFLEENHLLDLLTPEDQYCVLFAATYHSEKEVPSPSPDDPEFVKKAYNYCYILRDLDKLHLFFEFDKYHRAEGVLGQLTSLHLLPQNALSEKPAILDFLKKILSSEQTANLDLDQLNNFMTGPVNPNIIAAIRQHQSANLADIKTSWSSYLAMRLAMLFDVQHPTFINEAIKRRSEFIDPSLEYISRFDTASANQIKDHLHQVFGTEFLLK